MRSAWAGILIVLFWGCETSHRNDLQALASAEPMGPNCASCHYYPPRDPNHVFHLSNFTAFSKNGNITCRDCHTESILGHPTLVFDSIFVKDDSLNRPLQWNGLAYPDFEFIRDWILLRVDTLHQIRPVEQPGYTQSTGYLKQWMTGVAHLNGVIDVDIDSINSDTSRFEGHWAVFNPSEQSCSAVQCHRTGVDYRWPNPSKGLPARGRYDSE
jgi:hypothetical protein